MRSFFSLSLKNLCDLCVSAVKFCLSWQHTRKGWLTLILITLLIMAGATLARAYNTASDTDSGQLARQQAPTAVPLVFPTFTATAGPPTETPTRTPTQGSGAMIEAVSPDTNVRAGPDITENRIGQIQPGAQYRVLGKRFEWYQIEYPQSPTGTGWVHYSVVTLTGDPATIPELELGDIPTIDPAFLDQQKTSEAIANTPGAAATLTAQALVTPTGIFTAIPGEAALEPGAPLPTFTYPPYTPTPVAFPRTNPPPVEATGIPPIVPIVPILALGALGLMGLLVSLLRRL